MVAINEGETRKRLEKINETKSQFSVKISSVNRYFATDKREMEACAVKGEANMKC